MSRPVASAQNIDILNGTHERTAFFKISASIGSHFKISDKNIVFKILIFSLIFLLIFIEFFRYFSPIFAQF